jgi:hypothetical protein
VPKLLNRALNAGAAKSAVQFGHHVYLDR